MHPYTSQPRRFVGASRLAFALALVVLSGCGDHSATEPEDLTGDPSAEAGPALAPAAADLGDQSSPSLAVAQASGAAAATTRLPKSFFVNPTSGNDSNPGTQLKPFKTLAKGLSLAIAGDTMRLAAGNYSAATNGEKFTTSTRQVAVAAGVKIFGTFQGEFVTFLHGAAGDLVGLDLKGAATVRNLFVTGFPTGVKASQGAQSFKNVVLDQNEIGLELSGSANATLTSSTVFVRPNVGALGADVAQQAQLTLVGGRISEGNPSCTSSPSGVSLHDAARLTMKNGASLQNFIGRALFLSETSKATLTGLARVERDLSTLGGCGTFSSVLTNDSATLTLKNAKITSTGGKTSVGIESNSRGLLTLDSAQVLGHTGAGITAGTFLRLVAKSGTVISGNSVGIDALSGPAILTISGTTVTNNTIGIRAAQLKLRNSFVAFNEVGIDVLRTAGFGDAADLGQTSSPGNNKIVSNSGTGVRLELIGVDIDDGTIYASGNTWNPSIQGSDGSGHYGQLLVNGASTNPSASGPNFTLPGDPGFTIQF